MTTSCSRQLDLSSFSNIDHVFAHIARKELLFRVFKWYVRSGRGCGHPERYQKMHFIDRTDCNSLSVCPLSTMRLFDCPLRYSRGASQLRGMDESRDIARPPPGPGGRGRARPCRPRSIRRLTAAEVRHGDRFCRYGSLWSPILVILLSYAAGTKHAPRESSCLVRSLPFLFHRPAETLHINHDQDRL